MTYKVVREDLSPDEKVVFLDGIKGLFLKGTIAERIINSETGAIARETYWTPAGRRVGESFSYEDKGQEKKGYIVWGQCCPQVIFITEQHELNAMERHAFPDGHVIRLYNDAADEGRAIKGVVLDKEGRQLGEEYFDLNGLKGKYIIKGPDIIRLPHEECPKTTPPFEQVISPIWKKLDPEQRYALLFDGRFSVPLTDEQCDQLQVNRGSYVSNFNLTNNRFPTISEPNKPQISKVDGQGGWLQDGYANG